ncbi:MAG: UvrD-helicase domain-containing protein, partial [Pseudomonadota bacterium]
MVGGMVSKHALTDADAREQALDVSVSCIVQAPAGSGKTGLLTQRLLRLLLTVDQPEQVLAITFTRKAANEMRARVVQALNDAAAGQHGRNDFEAAIMRDARAVLERSDALGWALPQMPMRLSIMTVDGLNTRLTRRRPYQARTAGIDLLESAEVTAMYGDAADALFDWLTESGPVADAVTTFFEHIDANASQWRRELIQMLGRRDQWLPKVLAARATAPHALRAESERMLATLIESELRIAHLFFDAATQTALLDLVNAAMQEIPEAERIKHGLVALTKWPGSRASDLPMWRTVAHFVVTADTRKPAVRRAVNVKLGFGPKHKARKEAMLELLASLAEIDGLAESLSGVRLLPDATYTDTQWENIDALLTLLPALAAELSRLMSAAGKLDYPSLASAALMALGNSEVGEVSELALQMDYQLRHVLVDEMQDTSISQYRLLHALTAGWEPGDGRTLFCVGDPMQSIYRFRGAQVSLFLTAWQEGIGDVALTPLTLQTNFRSDTGIVDWVNATFPMVLGNDTDVSLERVSYSASTPAPLASSGGDVKWYPTFDAPTDNINALVTAVESLRRSDPDSSIAILARSRNTLEPVLNALETVGISVSGVEMDRLTDLPEVLDALTLTRALQHPLDDIAWIALLRAPFIGLSLARIDALVVWRDAQPSETRPRTIFDAITCDAFYAIVDADERRRIEHFSAAYARAIASAPTQPLHQRVLTLWYRLGGAAQLENAGALTNVHLFFDTLATFERNGQLDQLAALPALLDEHKVDRPGDGSGVSAMTIFKAKGLEFDHVFLPALERTSRNDDQQALYLEMHADSDAMLISAKAPRTIDVADPLHSLIARRERQRRHNELQRLFYVACTRARKSLHLFANAGIQQDESVAAPKTDSLLNVVWASAAPVFTARAVDGSSAQHTEEVSLRRPHRRVATR